MLGSSSTTRIFSLTAISLSLKSGEAWDTRSATEKIVLALIHRQQEGELAPVLGFALDPNLAAVRLNKALCDRETQAHAGRVAIDADEILENFLMMLGRYARARIFHRDFHAVRARQTEAAALLRRNRFRDAAFPEMGRCSQRNRSTGGRVFQRVVEQIRGGLLHLLIIETEIWNRWIKCGVEPNAFAQKRFLPALGEFVETIAQIIFAKLQNQLAAFERRVIQEHRHETN